ncbi:MAG: hypothetical protein KY450_14140 [Actinobacteria bacterium]|nr:hypothetical protein [Actinomycetota bacterium]
MGLWVAAAVVFGGLLVVTRAAEGPLDDTDPAWQRPGFVDAGPLPAPAPAVTENVPAEGRPSVVFFARPDSLGRLCHALASHDFGEDVDVVIVVAGSDQRCPGGTPVVGDPLTAIPRGYGMREPRGGGAPVGYAVVDRAGWVRYRTLDTASSEHLDEVETMVRATP